MDKWLITDFVHESAKTQLEEMGFVVDWIPAISNLEVLKIIDQYFGLIISTKTIIDKTLVNKASKLKIIGRVGVGMDHVNQIYCKEKGIECFNSPGGNANAVAEHVIGMLFGFSKNIYSANHQIKNGIWKRTENTGFEIKGKTIGIIGFGNTGSSLAKKLVGFDCEILAYDKYKSGFGTAIIKEATYLEILDKADVISFHVPYTTETHHWINNEFITSCKQHPLIINASRGAICNTPDLLWAIQNNKIKGCCIDVFEDEPISKGKIHSAELYKKLLAFDNVIASPHIAGWSYEAKQAMVEILMNQISKFLKNQT